MKRRGWWRRNRWWTLALPVALVLAVAGNAHRVQTFWWDNGYHQEVASADRDEWVDVEDPYVDPHGPGVRTFSVRLTGLEEVDTVPVRFGDPTSPPGMQGYLVRLDFRAEADVPMKGCYVAVYDDQGRRYGGDGDVVDTGHGCVPADHPGPDIPYTRETPRGGVVDERPDRWSVQVPVLVRRDARLDHVRLMWDWNDYTTLRLQD